MVKKRLANLILEMRRESGLSQAIVANELQVSQQTYSRIEAGTRPLTLDQFIALAVFFERDPQVLLAHLLEEEPVYKRYEERLQQLEEKMAAYEKPKK